MRFRITSGWPSRKDRLVGFAELLRGVAAGQIKLGWEAEPERKFRYDGYSKPATVYHFLASEHERFNPDFTWRRMASRPCEICAHAQYLVTSIHTHSGFRHSASIHWAESTLGAPDNVHAGRICLAGNWPINFAFWFGDAENCKWQVGGPLPENAVGLWQREPASDDKERFDAGNVYLPECDLSALQARLLGQTLAHVELEFVLTHTYPAGEIPALPKMTHLDPDFLGCGILAAPPQSSIVSYSINTTLAVG